MATQNLKEAILIVQVLDEGFTLTTCEKAARDPETEPALKLLRQVIAKLDPVHVKVTAIEDQADLAAAINAEIDRL